MPDVFNRTIALGGVMSADATLMTFSGQLDKVGLIIQQVEIQYQQNISRLFALESGKVYFVAGPTQGTFGATHVVGPEGIQSDFYSAYGDVCAMQKEFRITANAGCGVASRAKKGAVILSHPVISSVNVRAQADNMIIYSGFSATFTEMAMQSG